MIEHRLIERMIALLKKEADRIDLEKNIDNEFLDTAIDFILTYADRLHHGKEEDVLFHQLSLKDLSREHRQIMEELIEDHRQGRKAVHALAEAKAQVLAGNPEMLPEVLRQIRSLVDLYPPHVEKEDRHFFLPCMEYFSTEEKNAMLGQEHEFDKNIIHQHYKDKVVKAEERYNK
jgi:hemerythrin-like domain-containing protein